MLLHYNFLAPKILSDDHWLNVPVRIPVARQMAIVVTFFNSLIANTVNPIFELNFNYTQLYRILDAKRCVRLSCRSGDMLARSHLRQKIRMQPEMDKRDKHHATEKV